MCTTASSLFVFCCSTSTSTPPLFSLLSCRRHHLLFHSPILAFPTNPIVPATIFLQHRLVASFLILFLHLFLSPLSLSFFCFILCFVHSLFDFFFLNLFIFVRFFISVMIASSTQHKFQLQSLLVVLWFGSIGLHIITYDMIFDYLL